MISDTAERSGETVRGVSPPTHLHKRIRTKRWPCPSAFTERIWEADKRKVLFGNFWVSEWGDDKLETTWKAPIPC